MDEGYDAEDAFFNGYFYKIKTPQFILVNGSRYGNRCDFKQESIDYRGNICYIPTKGYCFIKCINFLTGKDYNQEILEFIRNEDRRNNIMTMARIQPCSGKLGVSLGFYNGKKYGIEIILKEINLVFTSQSILCNMEISGC